MNHYLTPLSIIKHLTLTVFMGGPNNAQRRALRRKGFFKASRSESFCDMLRRMSWSKRSGAFRVEVKQ